MTSGSGHGVTVKDVNPHDFVKAFSAHLKRSIHVRNSNILIFLVNSSWNSKMKF
jgi:DNA polymerase III alpha subunit (gram-positive type)